MNPIIDLTDFSVIESDDGETYVVLKKQFETLKDAVLFQDIIKDAVLEQAKDGVFKKCSTTLHPFSYSPLIKIKAKDFFEAFDQEGCLIDEESEPDEIEQLVSILSTELHFANPENRSLTDPAFLQITITIGIPFITYEAFSKEEATITCLE